MLLTKKQFDMMYNPSNSSSRVIARRFAGKWNSKVEGKSGWYKGVPYQLSNEFTKRQQATIFEAMWEIQDSSCVR